MSEVSAAGGIGEDAGRQAPYGRLSARMALQLAAPHTWPAAILPALVAVAAAAAATGGVSVTMACALLAICVLMQSAVPDRLCGKRLVSRITYRNGFGSCRIIGDLNLISDQSLRPGDHHR